MIVDNEFLGIRQYSDNIPKSFFGGYFFETPCISPRKHSDSQNLHEDEKVSSWIVSYTHVCHSCTLK